MAECQHGMGKVPQQSDGRAGSLFWVSYVTAQHLRSPLCMKLLLQLTGPVVLQSGTEYTSSSPVQAPCLWVQLKVLILTSGQQPDRKVIAHKDA